MIKKERKLVKGDFKLFKTPVQTLKSEHLTAKVFNTQGASRFSFSVSKKIEKKAVLRNKIKRMGFLALSRYIANIKPGSLIQFRFTSSPPNQARVEEDVASIIKNIK
jgi:ribonuclease P protein component